MSKKSNKMENLKPSVDSMFDGLFYFFGLIGNPAEQSAKDVLKDSPGEKLRQDVSKVNYTIRETFNELKKDVLSLNE